MQVSRPIAVVGLGLLLLSLSLSCNNSTPAPSPPTPAMPPWFVDVTKELGIDFVHDPGPEPSPNGNHFMPQIVGSGCAFFDYDNDGRLDIYLINNPGPNSKSTNRLYHQEEDGRFKDVTAGSGLDISGHGMGVAIGDVNNDGLPDVLVTEFGRTRLFLNLGGGKFRDVTQEAGIDNRLWGTSAAFLDYDRDGWLDLVVTNYLDYDPTVVCTNQAGRRDYCTPMEFHGTVTRLFHNRGGQPSTVTGQQPALGSWRGFEDATLKSGVGERMAYGLGVLCADFNGDGWPDIFIANDTQANHLWINQKDGTFKEEGVARNVAFNRFSRPEGNMGIAFADIDGDGMADLFVTHLRDETNRLWKQGPRGYFQDISLASGLGNPQFRGTGFGTVMADFDNDGILDVAVVNGSVAQPNRSISADTPHFRRYAERNQLFAGLGKGQFRDISVHNPAVCESFGVYRALACGDFNNDGGIDLLATTVAGPARLYRNVAPNRGHWVLVRALVPCEGVGSLFQGGPTDKPGTQGAAPGRPEKDSRPRVWRDAYGAEITVRVGERKWLGMVSPGASYLSSHDPRVHFGLGSAAQVDEIRVRWPDGNEEVFAATAADKIIVVRQGEGRKP